MFFTTFGMAKDATFSIYTLFWLKRMNLSQQRTKKQSKQHEMSGTNEING